MSHTDSSLPSALIRPVVTDLGLSGPSPSAARRRVAKGIGDVEVKTGISPRFIGEGVVPLLTGSHCSGCVCGSASGDGPSGWYRTNTSGAAP